MIMRMQVHEIQQRFNFIDRTLAHATHACEADASVPRELKDYIRQLDEGSGKTREALFSQQEFLIRQTVDALAQLSYLAQKSISRPSEVNSDIKCAVIMAYLEICALRYQVH